MKKKLLSMLLSMVLILSAVGISVPVTAMADTMMVVTVGADLTEEQKNMILNYFNVAGKSYTTITVTNDDEWSHLGSYMSRDIVGYKTISCALIRPMTSGGIQVKTANLTYVTSNMIASNLATAGVVNCEVLAAAPFQVSGTGALTGALMAYENLSGVTLDQTKKEAAAQEFATTYELGQTIGQQEAQQIVNDVKMQVISGTLEEDNSVTQEEITEIVNNVVNNYTTNTTNVTNTNTTTGLSEEAIAALQNLAVEIAKESYEQGTIDALAQIQKTLEGQTKTASTDATTQIEENASSTISAADAESNAASEAVTTDATTADDSQSAADQALAQDSLLLNTDESALAGTTEDGSVISSSTAEKSIDTEVATNLDAQIEEEQEAAVAETTVTDTTAADATAADATGIPEATDSTVLGLDETAEQTTAETSAEAVTDPAAADTTGDTTVDAETPADTTDPTVTADAGADVAAEAQNAIQITNDDLINGTVSLESFSTTADGTQQASGAALVALTVPYENLTPVTAGLRITNADGSDAATFTYDSAMNNMVLLTSANDANIPAGSTKILMMPADCSDISGQTNFSPAAGQTYNYNVNAEFTSADQSLNIQITEYMPYLNAVSESGFAPDSYSVNRSYTEGATGTVLFPSDVPAAYATVTADAQSMAMVSFSNPNTPDAMPMGVTRDAGDSVVITPVQSGLVTLTITYYDSAETAGADPAASLGTAVYTMYFAG